MLALAPNEIEDTAKSMAVTALMPGVADTDEHKALLIAMALDSMPDITTEQKLEVIGSLPAYGISQAVADLTITKLGAEAALSHKWHAAPWIKVAIVIAVVAAVGGTTYMVWRRKA